jgi:hypothetical protein
MSSTGARLEFAAPSRRSKVIMEDYMPIRIKPHDIIIASRQQSDISLVMTDAILVIKPALRKRRRKSKFLSMSEGTPCDYI